MSSINRRNNRLSPEYVLLGYLYELPSHGYELHQRLVGDFGNIWHASQSQIYNILKRLELQGYITSTNVEQEKLPARQRLTITESGRARFNAWLVEPTKSSVHAIRVEFVTRLYFMQLYYPENILDMIDVQIDTVKIGLKELHEDLAHLSVSQTFSRLALNLRIKLLTSVITWLYECNKAFASDG